jgi:hypothetical protein
MTPNLTYWLVFLLGLVFSGCGWYLGAPIIPRRQVLWVTLVARVALLAAVILVLRDFHRTILLAWAVGFLIWPFMLYSWRLLTALTVGVCEVIMSFVFDPENSEHGIDPTPADV